MSYPVTHVVDRLQQLTPQLNANVAYRLSAYRLWCGPSCSMDDVRKRLARNVRVLREKADISQDVFADMVGVHRTYMSGIERGKRNPSIDVVERIATALSVEPGRLLQ